MLLTEMTQTLSASLPIAALKDMLRLGTAFDADGLGDALLEPHLRAAIAAIEARIGKVLLARNYRLTLQDWRSLSEQALPLAPVAQITSVTVFDAANIGTVQDLVGYRLIADTHRPKIAAVGKLFATVPSDGRIEIVFTAGFGAAWAEVPADLAQAVLLLAAQYYEGRHEIGTSAQGLPAPVQALIERWRIVRVLGGGAA